MLRIHRTLFVLLALCALVFLSAFSTNQNATVVIGQANFTTATVNTGGLGANTNNNGTCVWAVGGGLAIADQLNNRVLLYNGVPTTNNASANVVVGQANFTSNTANQGGGVNSNTLNTPVGVYSTGSTLIIADRANNR